MGAAYIVTNLITGSITITPSTEDAVYTKASLYDLRIQKPFRWTAKTGDTLLFSFSGAVTVDLVAILAHNFTAAVTANLKYGTTNACADGTEALTYAATNIYKHFGSQSKQYWKLEIDDASNSANPEICEMYLGVAVDFSRMYSFGWEEGKVFINDEQITEFGTVLPYAKYNVRTRRLPWNTVTATMKDEIAALINATTGSLIPYVLIPDLTSSLCLFGRNVSPYGAVASPPPFYSTFLDFREESKGKTVLA